MMFHDFTEVYVPTNTVEVKRTTGGVRVSNKPDVISVQVKIEKSHRYDYVIHVKNSMNETYQLYIRNHQLVFHTGPEQLTSFPWQTWLQQYLSFS